jgi:hypothetical protein
VADPPTALAVTAEGASCAARAGSVSCMLAARDVSRLIASRMVFRAQGESPQRLTHDKREQRGSVSRATRLHRSQEMCVTTITLISARGRLPTPMPAPAPTRIPAPGATTRQNRFSAPHPAVPSRRALRGG